MSMRCHRSSPNTAWGHDAYGASHPCLMHCIRKGCERVTERSPIMRGCAKTQGNCATPELPFTVT